MKHENDPDAALTVRALRTSTLLDNGKPRFSLGEIGGALGMQAFLDHNNDSWIKRGSIAISGSQISDNAWVKDNVYLYETDVKDNAIVEGNANLMISSIKNNARIGGNANIIDSRIKDDVRITGHPKIMGSDLTDNVKVNGNVSLINVICKDSTDISTKELHVNDTEQYIKLSGVDLSGTTKIISEGEHISIKYPSHEKLMLRDTVFNKKTNITENTLLLANDGLVLEYEPDNMLLDHYALSCDEINDIAKKRTVPVISWITKPLANVCIPGQTSDTYLLPFSLAQESRLKKMIRDEYNLNNITVVPQCLYAPEDTNRPPPLPVIHQTILQRDINENPYNLKLNSTITPIMRSINKPSDTLSILSNTTDINSNNEMINNIILIDLPAEKFNVHVHKGEVLLSDKENKNFTILNTSFLDDPATHFKHILKTKTDSKQMTLTQYTGKEKRDTKESEYNPTLDN